MKLLIGLGNPTREYVGTRHNIGFDAITRISDTYGITVTEKKHKAMVGKGVIEGEKVLLIKPETYMNLSGESVIDAVNYYKTGPEDIIVFCDDINLEPGQIRIRKKGSAGGHNGLKNIIAHLGTEDFARCRIGVGEKPEGWDLADHVLGHFPKEQEPLIRDALKDAEDVARLFVRGELDAAMNLYNKKKK